MDNSILEIGLLVVQECDVDNDNAPNLIDHCLSIECPKKRMICLNLIRKLNGDNPEYLARIDRFIDDITGNYENSGEM